MISKKYVLFALIVYLVFAAAPALANDDPINWQKFDEKLIFDKPKDKKVYIFFYSDWCKYCKKMIDETFTDAAVADYLNNNFINMKIDSGKNVAIAQKFRIRGIPDNWFITKQGEIISHTPGYIPPDHLLAILKYYHTDSYKKMTFSDFIKGM